MTAQKQSRGTCQYCGNEYAKGGMIRHLRACSEREEAITAAEQQSNATETLYHLRAQDNYIPDFWLDLEMRSSATLKELDRYLRAIWLECCGHLSQFSIGGWSGREIAMSRRTDQVFRPNVELTHIYDFGTSSETLVKVVDVRQGAPTSKRPIALMARNLQPEANCIECGQPASWLCMECLIEENIWGALCNEHAETHPHGSYGPPTPIVNSPRVGMCGYTGPAEPPY
ncbi:MAG: hypothetical protein MAG451_00536 [Anaerolineales bacterium]|nr:hypothetical protein [Anaerolineales bacterium]